jgi:hypothetical protein
VQYVRRKKKHVDLSIKLYMGQYSKNTGYYVVVRNYLEFNVTFVCSKKEYNFIIHPIVRLEDMFLSFFNS